MHNKSLYCDSLLVRGQGNTYIDESRQQAFTGPPHAIEFAPDHDKDQDPQDDPDTNIHEDEIDFTDVFEMIPTAAYARPPTSKISNDFKIQEEKMSQEDTKTASIDEQQ